MIGEVSSNRNYSVYFFALLKWAENLLQPQIFSGDGVWRAWHGVCGFLVPLCWMEAAGPQGPIRGTKTLLIFGGCGVWEGFDGIWECSV